MAWPVSYSCASSEAGWRSCCALWWRCSSQDSAAPVCPHQPRMGKCKWFSSNSWFSCHLLFILPAAYGHMVLSWARVGNCQLDSDLEEEFFNCCYGVTLMSRPSLVCCEDPEDMRTRLYSSPQADGAAARRLRPPGGCPGTLKMRINTWKYIMIRDNSLSHSVKKSDLYQIRFLVPPVVRQNLYLHLLLSSQLTSNRPL